MADPTGGSDLRFSPAGNKRTAPNVSGGWVVMVLSGLIAVIIFLFVTAQGAQKFQVLVAAHDIAPGTVVHGSDFHVVSVNLDQAQLGRLIAQKDESSYDGYIAIGPLSGGDLVTKSLLQPSAGPNGNVAMSIPIDKSHAVNGNIKVGDTIDLVDETNGAVAVSGLQVTAVDQASGNALGATSTFTITVGATADQATAIAKELKDNKFDVVNATGAPPINVTASTSGSSPSTTTP